MQSSLDVTLSALTNGLLVEGELITLPPPGQSNLSVRKFSEGIPRFTETGVNQITSDLIETAYHYSGQGSTAILHPFASGTITSILVQTTIQPSLAALEFREGDVVVTSGVAIFFNARQEFLPPRTVTVVTVPGADLSRLSEAEWDTILGPLVGFEFVVLPLLPPVAERLIERHKGLIHNVYVGIPTRVVVRPVIKPRVVRPVVRPILRVRPIDVYTELLKIYETYVNMVLIWMKDKDYKTFETRHDYIQILFPTDQPGTTHREYTLQAEDITKLKANETFLALARLAFSAMMDFYGLVISNDDLIVIDENRHLTYFVRGGTGQHNYLRITRILRFLTLMELNDLLIMLREHIQLIYVQYPGVVPEKTREFWGV